MASGAGLRPVSLERNYVEEGYLLEVPAKQRRTAFGKDYPSLEAALAELSAEQLEAAAAELSAGQSRGEKVWRLPKIRSSTSSPDAMYTDSPGSSRTASVSPPPLSRATSTASVSSPSASRTASGAGGIKDSSARAFSPVNQIKHPDMERLRALRPDVTPVGSPLISPVISRCPSWNNDEEPTEETEIMGAEHVRGELAHSCLLRRLAPDTPAVGQQPVDHTFVSTTIKGARTSNEDTHFSDGRFFSLFDGHGGQLAARMCRAQLSQHFCHLLESGKFLGPAPKPVQALHQAFVKTQEAMPRTPPASDSGATAIACWLEDSIHENALKIYAACAGDSQAIVFNKFSARIPTRKCRLWDDEMQTLDSSGEEAFLPYETTPHGCTGPLIRDDAGKVVGMGNDPTGVGLREYQLLRRRHRFSGSQEVRCLSNMPGEERYRVLQLEPTRALGHAGKALGPLTSPEIYEWEVAQCHDHMLLMCCDGFFSKNAFKSTNHLVEFLVNPMDCCHRSDFFSGTCVAAFLKELRVPLPDPAKCSMGSLFKFIYTSINDKLSDEVWRSAHDSAYEFLSRFAREKPVPNIRTHPAKTLLAASYLAVLMVGDDNCSATLVMLDDCKVYGNKAFQLGEEPK